MKDDPFRRICELEEFPDHSKPFKLDWKKWAMTCDWHCPFVDKGMFKKLIKECLANKVTNLFIGGDYFDMNAFGKFFSFHRVPWAREKAYAKDVFQIINEVFQNKAFMASNHEIRWMKALQAQSSGMADMLDPFELIGLKDTKVVSLKQWVYIGNWMIVHPRHARKIPLSLARELSAINTSKHIVVTHAHMQGKARSHDGSRWIFDCGCMADPKKVEYKQYNVTAHYDWNKGFAIIDNDIINDIWEDV